MKIKSVIAFFLLFFCVVIAKEKEGLNPSAVFVHSDAKGKLPIIGNLAVIIEGDDRLNAQIIEDGIAVNLLAESIRLVYPLEKELGRERKRIFQPIEFAKRAGANCLITGTVVGRCRACRGKKGCSDEEIRLVSFSLIDIPEDKILLWAVYEPDSSQKPLTIARDFVELLIENLKP